MSEFDTGLRSTRKGNDRFAHTILPVAQESVLSMLQGGYHVDLYFITHYSMSSERRVQLSKAMPDGVGIQVWDDATPLGYDEFLDRKQVVPVMRALARQHRFVIKDKFSHYDMFVNFEDDMVIHGAHLKHFVNVTQTLFQLRRQAVDALPVTEVPTVDDALERFHGDMTKIQLERCIPGFMRVEVALPGFQKHRRNLNPIPIDHQWRDASESHIDPSVCCKLNASLGWLPHQTPTGAMPSQLHYWETSIEGLQVRQLPNQEWVLLHGGNKDDLYLDPSYPVGGYWVGRAHSLNSTDNDATASGGRYLSGLDARPDPTKGRFISNQGGWMGTRRQIRDWDARHCRGGFLPPYDAPHYVRDGLESRTVEFWSGGISLAGVMSCNLQRVVPLDPDRFSAHLLYHVSNNKQKERNLRYRFSSHTVDEFWAQLNAVRKSAEFDRDLELQKRRQPHRDGLRNGTSRREQGKELLGGRDRGNGVLFG
jgi:hypothetical protein